VDQDQLAELTLALIEVPSVSRNESALADFVMSFLAGFTHLKVERSGNTIWAETLLGQGERTLLAGHLDTVPGELERWRRGGTIAGRGAVDMKGGLAVMLGLAAKERRSNVTYVFYPCEEVDASENGLRFLAKTHPEVFRCARGVVLEPTGADLEAGCQGTLRVRVEVKGVRAHSARPFMGDNALVHAAEVVTHAELAPRRRPVIDGLEFRESLVPVRFESFVANNVVPDYASVWFNHRFAPDRDVASAMEWVRSVVMTDSVDAVELEDSAPGALPHLEHFKELKELIPTSRAKLGWTDVSFLGQLGVPAVNFGPGNPELAHGNEEAVFEVELGKVFRALNSWLR